MKVEVDDMFDFVGTPGANQSDKQRDEFASEKSIHQVIIEPAVYWTEPAMPWGYVGQNEAL